jgi:predicted ATPase
MYLSRLFIQNFRSIKSLDLSFKEGKNIIIGRNNSGKSNIISAIDLVLGENTPDYKKSENITDNDFYTNDNEKSNIITIWCELTRAPNEPLNYEALYDCYGFYIQVENDRSTPKLINNDYVPDNLCTLFSEIIQDKAQKYYVDPKKRGNNPLENLLEGMFSFAYGFVAKKEVDGSISKELRTFFRTNNESGWIMSFRASFRNELIQSAIIPSFRDPQNQLRLSQWGWYGKLIRALTEGANSDQELRNAMDKMNEVARRIFSEISSNIETNGVNIAFPGTKLHFQFSTENKVDIYKNCVLYVDDGFKSQITEKGSGIQSAVIIGLFNYYVRFVNTKSSALLCIEEPELYLHPHARRVINLRLSEFLNDNQNQVIFTTHSTEFINTADDIQLILVRKENFQTFASSIKIKDFQNILVDNNQNEIFFADKVILCEGFDNYIVKMIAEEEFPGALDEKNISVVSVCGKDNFNFAIKQLGKLGIMCFFLSDFDFFLRDKEFPKEKFPDLPVHDNILSITPNYFFNSCIYGDEWKKYQSIIQSLREKIKKEDEEGFYVKKELKQLNIDPDYIKVIDELLRDLRFHAVGILSTEIEGVIGDGSIFKKRKFTLSDIYNIRKFINEGNKFSDIANYSEISEFLRAVIRL